VSTKRRCSRWYGGREVPENVREIWVAIEEEGEAAVGGNGKKKMLRWYQPCGNVRVTLYVPNRGHCVF